MTISFSEIPSTKRLPGAYAEIDSSLAVRGLPGMPHKVLIIGQRLSTGDQAANVPYLVTDPEQAARGSGRGSMAHAMATKFRSANDYTETWVVGVDDAGAGVAAVKTVTIGKADGAEDFGAGTLGIRLGGRRIRVAVAADDTESDVAAALVAAATDTTLTGTLAVDGSTTEQINVTAKHKGLAAAEGLDLRTGYLPEEILPFNMTVTFGETTAGSGDPDIAATLAAVSGEWWTEIAMPYRDGANYTAMHEWLLERFGATDMRQGHAFSVSPGTVAGLNTWGESVNSQFITTLPTEGSPTPPYEIAADYAGIAAYQFAIDPARQLRTLALPGVLPPQASTEFTSSERELLLFSGISAVDMAGGSFRLSRCITNYQLSALGAEDTAYLDLTTMTTLRYIRWAMINRIELRYPRHKLAKSGTNFAPGQAVATPETIKGELIGLYSELETAGLVEDKAFFVERLIVERDGSDPNRINALLTPDIINNFRIFAAKIQFVL